MFMPAVQDAPASTASHANLSAAMAEPSKGIALPAAPPPPDNPQEPIRHLLFGTLPAVQATIRLLHKRGYAEPNDWSQPISTGRPNEVMAILTKRVRLDR
jgi:hypothetical protein